MFPFLTSRRKHMQFSKICFLVIWNSGRWTESTNSVIPGIMHHLQDPLHPAASGLAVLLKNTSLSHFELLHTQHHASSQSFLISCWSRSRFRGIGKFISHQQCSSFGSVLSQLSAVHILTYSSLPLNLNSTYPPAYPLVLHAVCSH
jgi:hypothetical protein